MKRRIICTYTILTIISYLLYINIKIHWVKEESMKYSKSLLKQHDFKPETYSNMVLPSPTTFKLPKDKMQNVSNLLKKTETKIANAKNPTYKVKNFQDKIKNYIEMKVHQLQETTLNKTATNNIETEVMYVKTSFQKPMRKIIFPFEKLKVFRSNWETTPYSLNKEVEIFKKWDNFAVTICDKKIRLFNHEFLHTSHMLVNKGAAQSGNYGGEDMQDVLNQTESSEYYDYKVGFFATKCTYKPTYKFNLKNHLNDWYVSTLTSEPVTSEYIVREFSIAVVRYEYANFYHSMTDWYNAFLMMEFFKMTSANTNILIIDTHPHGKLDTVWSHLFNYTRRLSELPPTTLFTNLVWGIQSYNTPLKSHFNFYPLPLVEEFRDFFLRAYNVSQTRTINCSRLNILIIWRRDYVAHPRNPKGKVGRKIANEGQIVEHLKNTLSSENFNIRESQMDLLAFESQLDSVVWTDIMIGMHGAGLTHALFLNKKSALIELRPFWARGHHFEAIAKWRNLHYLTWLNKNRKDRFEKYSYEIPPGIISSLILTAKNKLCT